MEVYDGNQPINVASKKDDSPVTAADIAAHKVIVSGLQALDPDTPILSEEDPPSWEVRQHWQRYWLVDPLDGTKEFIKRNGEFTVNIALIENGKPTLGVVYAPVMKVMYSAGKRQSVERRVRGAQADPGPRCPSAAGGDQSLSTVTIRSCRSILSNWASIKPLLSDLR